MFGECHAHIFMDGVDYKRATLQHCQEVDEASIRSNFAAYQKRGVTYIRDGGDALGVSQKARAIAPEYNITYRTPIFAIHKKGHYGSIVGRCFQNMKEYQSLVGEVASKGGDFIKIMASGIMDFDRFGSVTGAALPQADIREMIRIAHGHGLVVMVHANGADVIKHAVLAGADSIEHGYYMDDECLAMMADNDVVWVPTLAPVCNLIGNGRFPDAVLRQIASMQQENMQQAYRKNVQMALGSDAGAYAVLHGRGIEDEYRFFQETLKDYAGVEQHLANGEQKIRMKFQKESGDKDAGNII